ncbi:H(+)/Cl(-) exchange transporter ClcA [Ancylobacter dichloromethanicus]|uniref:Chloride channel protein n=1 Tax=Ancylobacter dichloromethanicus TaxID=518825 RepID=A0A9W6JEN8_9HYPH|nr:H(+)/Cl(-) exchange transporter ClcA [Ancylobacter dichloromethanicus]MBS7552471.1 H(+)/Cl(-) exchange transporter ClcA [Ancylobacter dichloromethanicus]GLK74213.1 chloride channel protein [Ancylobacter dichloromethanicus]
MGNVAYHVVAILVGAVVGVLGSGFHVGVEKLTAAWPAFLDTGLGLDGFPLYAAAALVAAAMTVVSLWLVRRFAPEASGSGVPEIEGAMEGLREVHWHRVLPVKFVAGLLSLSSGMVLGREGPTIHIGASVAKAASDLMKWSGEDMRGLLAAGGAAGLAAAFNAPLAAVLFVIEETRRQFPYSSRTYIAVVLASIASAIVTEYLTGNRPYMLLEATAIPYGWLPAFALLGLILGGAGFVFNRTLVWSLDHVRRFGMRSSFYIFPTFVGLTVGVLMFVRPEATQGGELLAVQLTKESLPLGMLAFVVLLRFVMTMASYSTGVAGGIFAPILALATTIGLCYGTTLDLFFDLPYQAHTTFAIAAMGGLFAATIGAPLVGMVLVLELTSAYAVLVPVMICAIFAHMAFLALGGRPIYEILLERTLAIEAEARAAGSR